MKKLWKGIFYCEYLRHRLVYLPLILVRVGFWMSDKPLVQQALASELAELVLAITSNSASIAFLKGFWQTIVREWNPTYRAARAILVGVSRCATASIESDWNSYLAALTGNKTR